MNVCSGEIEIKCLFINLWSSERSGAKHLAEVLESLYKNVDFYGCTISI